MDSPTGSFEVFFDGDCPLCRREIGLLKRLDRNDRLIFTDISQVGFDATGVGKDFDAVMRSIHGRDEKGVWYQGVEVFRQLYARIGFGKTVAFSRWPLIRHCLPVFYRMFAAWRYRSAMKRWRSKQCSIGTCQPGGSR